MGRMAGIHADRMIRALERLGWIVKRSSGAHHSLYLPGRGVLVISVKKGRSIPEGTARAILRQAGLSEEQFFAAYR